MAKNDFKGTLQEGLNLLNQYEQKLVSINAIVEKVVNGIAQSNKNGFDVKTPQAVNTKIKERSNLTEQLNAQLKEQNRVEKALITQIERNKIATESTNRALIKERFETQQRNKEIKASAILSSKLSTEYQKLVVRMNRAGAAVQNLTAKKSQGIRLSNKEQAELKQSQIQFKLYQKSVLKADASIGRFQRNVGNYSSALGKAGFALKSFAATFGIFSAGIIAREIFNTVKELDGLDKALKQVTETTENYTRAQSFLNDLAEEAGVQIQGLQGSYTKFLASAKTTNLTLEETEDIFRQTAKAGAVLGLSTDDINGSFRALEQILSKGKVQAEEIRGQLGERLPGAFQILAKSIGLTTQELDKQLSLGKVISEDVLPNFAKELEKTYSLGTIDRVETLTGAQNRLSNAWTEFIRSVEGGDSVLTNVFTNLIDLLTKAVRLQSALLGTIEKKNPVIEETYESTKKLLDAQENSNEVLEKLVKSERGRLAQIKTSLKFDKLSKEETEVKKEEMFKSVGVLKALTEKIKSNTEKTNKNTKEVKENTEARKQTMQALEGSIAFYKKIISGLTKERENLATNSAAYKDYTDQIIAAQVAINVLKGELNQLKSQGTTEGFGESVIESSIANNEILDRYRTFREQQEEIDKRYFETRKQLESDAVNGVIDLTNAIFDNRAQRIEDDINRSNDYYAQLLDNENLSEEQRSAIEAERDRKERALEKKKRQEQRKAAIFNKLVSIAEIGIETAKNIVQVFPNPALIALAAATGAIQAAAVAATPIPQYKHGRKDGKAEFAIVGDGGKHEIVKKKDGSMSLTPNKSTLTYLDKDDEVIPDAKKYLDSIGNKELTKDLYRHTALASLTNQGVMMSQYLKNVDNGLEKQTDRLIKELKPKATRFNIQNNVNLEYLMRSQNILQ